MLVFVELVKSVQFQAKKLPEGRPIADDRKIRRAQICRVHNAQNEAEGGVSGGQVTHRDPHREDLGPSVHLPHDEWRLVSSLRS